jgi:molybdopterin-containing oxidoreductase family iron-sulfur binding subunit
MAVERALDERGALEGEAPVLPAHSPTDPLVIAESGQAGLRESAPSLLDRPIGRRRALGTLAGAVLAGAQMACSGAEPDRQDRWERSVLGLQELSKKNFRVMTDEEKAETIARLERLSELRNGVSLNMTGESAEEGVLFGYAFNVSKCKGYRECVRGCVEENNQDRASGIQYIRIFEIEGGEVNFEEATAEYQHEVPREGHFYLGTQCFQCTNPPCVEVCPVAATWQEPDGIVVIDYDWCIGCRYCIAACPYWARRFNWSEPQIPAEQINPNQHYLGNRLRRKGCVEKCTYCIQRTRKGRVPACHEACPTGARIFGNLLDPDSEIRWIIENKQVFRLKQDLGTEPRFWYFMD